MMSFSCSSTKSVASESTSEEAVEETSPEQKREDMIKADGYFKGKVANYSDKEGCGIVIELVDVDRVIIPVELENTYRQEGLMLWVKFTDSRIQQSCGAGSPAVIHEVKVIE